MFPQLKQLHASSIRVNLWWGGPQRRRRAAAGDAANPADPAYDWATYDRTVRYAPPTGMQPIFTVLGTPRWANRVAGLEHGADEDADLQAFATAAASRYSGTYAARTADIGRASRTGSPGTSRTTRSS